MATEKQRRFAYEYLADGNATQAAIRAGYAEGSAHVTASRLLRDPRVRDILSREQSAREERLQISADEIERRLWQIANEDRADRVRALAILAKRHVFASERTPRDPAQHLHLHNLSDEALFALVERIREQGDPR